MARLRAALLALLLLLPVAQAANGDVGDTARVDFVGHDATWNGVSARNVSAPGIVQLWMAPGARLHNVVAVTDAGNVSVSWRALGDAALEADAPAGTREIAASFDFRANPLVLASYVAPDAPTSVDISVRPGNGMAVEGDPVAFADDGNGTWHATLDAGQATEGVTIHVVDEDRVGELPILLTVGVVAVLSVALVALWHRVRPPLEGRSATRFLEHLAELQARLMPVVVVFVFLNFAYFASGLRIVHWRNLVLVAPTWSVDASLASRAFEAFATRLVPAGVQLVVLRPADAVLAQVQMTLFLAFVSVLPLLLYEMARFVGPALAAKERAMATRVIPLILGLFGIGCLFGYLLMAPLMIRTLYSFAPATGAAPFLVVGDLISFALLVIVAFGLAFELPVLMYVTSRLGLVKAKTYRHYLRHAIVAIIVIAGIVTPDPSVVSQLLVAIPVTLLYLLGMGAAALAENRRARAKAAPSVA